MCLFIQAMRLCPCPHEDTCIRSGKPTSHAIRVRGHGTVYLHRLDLLHGDSDVDLIAAVCCEPWREASWDGTSEEEIRPSLGCPNVMILTDDVIPTAGHMAEGRCADCMQRRCRPDRK